MVDERASGADRQALAAARVQAAEELDRALANVREPITRLQNTTQQLEAALGVVDRNRRLEVPIVLALVRAGLGAFLERKLVGHGPPVPLRDFVDEQQRAFEEPAGRL